MKASDAYEAFQKLDREKQIDALVIACEPALVLWTTWAVREKPVYIDTVVGMRHVVDIDLPARALEEVRTRRANPGTRNAYMEPTVAMQDDDWEMSDALEYAYYAVYNLHRFAFEPDSGVTALLVLNQAISATLKDQHDSAEIAQRILEWWKRV